MAKKSRFFDAHRLLIFEHTGGAKHVKRNELVHRVYLKTGFISLTIVIFSVLGGLIFRWARLSEDSLWFDEIVTLSLIKVPWSELFRGILQFDSHPPLFLLIAKPWVKFFGTSELGVRSLAASIGMVSFLAIFYMGRVIGGLRTAFFSLMILAFHHFAIWYSEEFRSYILLFTLTTSSLGLFAKILLTKESKELRKPISNTGDYIFLSIVNLLLLLTHYYSLLLILFENLVYMYVGLKDPSKRWWKAQAVSFAGCAWWLPGLCFHALHLPLSHLGTKVDVPTLVKALSPTAASHLFPHQSFLLELLPYVCVALYSATLIFKNVETLQTNLDTKVEDSEQKKEMNDSSLNYFFLITYVTGLLLLLLSYFPFKSWRDPIISWSHIALEGAVLHSVIFMLLWMSAWLSHNYQFNKFVELGNLNSCIPRMLLGVFPLFVTILVEITCKVFRPNYEIRNMIIILPSFIVAMAWTLDRIKSDTIWLSVFALGFVGFVSQIEMAPNFRTRPDFRTIAKKVEEITQQRIQKPTIVVVSPVAKVSMWHYLKSKDFKMIDCSQKCEQDLAKETLTLWTWHDFFYGPEENSKHLLVQYLMKSRSILKIQAKGVKAMLIESKVK